MANSNAVTAIKWIAILGVAILAFIYLRGCRSGSGKIVVNDTIEVVRDTTIYETVHDTSFVPKPYKVVQWKDSIRIDSFETVDIIYADTSLVYADYFATRFYRDTVYNDSLATVVLEDTVHQNRSVGKSAHINFRLREVNNTVTIDKKRVTLYYGALIGGNKSNLFTTGGVTLGLMDKRGRYYGASANVLINGKPFYGGQVMFPIHIKKR